MPVKRRAFTPGRDDRREERDEADSAQPTDEDLATAKPFAGAEPELVTSHKRVRGPQKAPTKEFVGIRLDRDVVAAFKAGGAGWQSRINEALRKAAKLGRRPAASRGEAGR